MADNVIELRGVRKVYRMGSEHIVALRGITLDIARGEVCCLLGTSGSGKSTLLNMMAGLEKPTKGEIILQRHHIERMNENELAKFRQDHVGFVFQAYNLLPALSALENVALPMIFKGLSKKKREKIALRMLKGVGLGNRAKHKPGEMSGGQQQRVSIARAFVTNPEIIFADEPTGNLDTKTTDEVLSLILGLVRRNNQTLIMVTHNPDIAQFADKVVHIRDGAIENITLARQEAASG